ncbi:demethylmacrocin O-methyltransferase [Amycolatopsis pretoriensis]|uniref:Demethylmacrocin O-methyltransferase n=1 Tax=Amycolatopsis pretoriensis TaxID=218821 RepID=A0A1H5QFZ2_9PSEU|nr:class I SAM-dependent methyltransferase [Amycolatopsis pretoriensis]SEF24301.1 demethylmacrocin O-methyltransferase [Amycolatopsis pretoriensis]
MTPDIESLIRAASGRPDEIRAALDKLGLARVAELAVAEWTLRLDPPSNPLEIHIGLSVSDGRETADHTWVLRAGEPVRVLPGLHPGCEVRLRYDAEELITELWGPSRGRSSPSRAYELATAMDTHFPPRERQPSIAAASATLTAALSARAPDLGALAVRYGSDKWGQTHWFTQHYERHFAPLREEPVRLLEIGVGGYENEESGGGSLKMWRRYFPRASVFGLDYFDKSRFSGPRLTVVRGDQNDPAQLDALAKEHGPFDIVIDDGSHINEHVLTSFRALFPYVRSGGFYVIEDLWTSYLPGYGGDDRDFGVPTTMLGLLKTLLDDLHHQERDSDGEPSRDTAGEPSATEAGLVGMHVYHNIAFLEKGRNAEGGIPRWMPRAPHW